MTTTARPPRRPRSVHRRDDLVDHRCRQRVAGVGVVEGHRADPLGDLGEHVGHCSTLVDATRGRINVIARILTVVAACFRLQGGEVLLEPRPANPAAPGASRIRRRRRGGGGRSSPAERAAAAAAFVALGLRHGYGAARAWRPASGTWSAPDRIAGLELASPSGGGSGAIVRRSSRGGARAASANSPAASARRRQRQLGSGHEQLEVGAPVRFGSAEAAANCARQRREAGHPMRRGRGGEKHPRCRASGDRLGDQERARSRRRSNMMSEHGPSRWGQQTASALEDVRRFCGTVELGRHRVHDRLGDEAELPQPFLVRSGAACRPVLAGGTDVAGFA